ncbi:MFS transporter [Oricola thermophila]|uniref:MFS transporter n=1 Tax=Oricola thermophila TaxID=2742145 RepID=A0A6N1V8V5_9HYPH|nr:MFS transporter [Oricola thermophila]QKV17148.1 MFS transporter [Oricola thermophila]
MQKHIARDSYAPGGAVTAVILSASALTVMANATIAPSLPELRAAFSTVPHIDTLAGLVLTMPSLFVILSAAALGWAADRMNRKLVLAACMIVYAAGGASGFLADNLETILGGRAVLGIGVAGTMTIASAYVADFWQGAERERFMGIQAAATNFGGIIFVLIGGFLTGIEWRMPFLLYLVGIPLAVTALAVLPGRAEPTSADFAAEQEQDGAGFPWAVAARVIPLALGLMTIFYILPTRLPFLMTSIGLTRPAVAGVALALVTLFSLPGSLGYGWLRRRLSSEIILAAAFALLGLGLVLISRAQDTVMLFAGVILCGAGFGPMIPNFMSRFLSAVPARQRARGAGLMTATLFGGQFLSPLVSGLVLQHFPLGDCFALFGAMSLAVGAVVGAGTVLSR